MTWWQIYGNKRCHYREGKKKRKKGKVTFISKKKRPEQGRGNVNITYLQALWAFVVKREAGFHRAFN